MGEDNIALCMVDVLTVSVSVTALPFADRVMDGGAKVQETFTGNVPQKKLTVPVYPPLGVMVIVRVPDAPGLMSRLTGVIVADTLAATTVSVTGFDALA
jgi:hypothetical protein